ncbi:putative lipoprotein [Streptomyces longisporoflavus]|uniref:hypothetical protein n=1 Tax=Streptomyces longisporoflavus TaxID=28044 RepID=UPI00167D9983|nr:hypothetical protein [Streptomyces longisporoflavus]GGV57088.1 putative lipoprotein [Streptomyces longisporoflavus]
MNSTTMRRAGLSIAVAAALTGVAACGSSGGGEGEGEGKGEDKGSVALSPVAALRTIEDKTDDADSAKIEGKTVMGSKMSMDMTGSMKWSDGITGNMTATLTGGTQAQQMEQMGQSKIDYRYLKNGFYANMGDKFAAQAGGGKHWIEYDYATLAEISGAAGDAFKDQMQNSTPNQSVKMLLASGDVKRVGEETVRGTKTTHYSGTVDAADFTGKNTDLDAGQMEELRKQFKQVGLSKQTIDIWVDGDDLLVKKAEKGEMADGEFSQTAYYSDYGTPVSVEKPAASDTMSFKDLMNRQPQA